MKKIIVLATLLMATTAAHAGNSATFQIDGHKVRIEVPNNCSSLSCIQVSASGVTGSGFGGFKGFKSNRFGDDDVVADRTDPPAAAAPQPVAPAPAPVATVTPAAPTTVATASPAPAVGFDTSTPAAPAAAPVAAAPAPAPTTPLGIWATEENKGDVRIEQCGQNLCGYAVQTNEKVLINMKAADAKWTGQIRDPDSGNNYDSTIAMKGPNTLRVQGCAFGGMFCGGQTWKRVS